MTPNNTPIAWRDFIIAHSDRDLLMVIEGQRLYYNSNPVHLHWLDRVSLLLIRQAYAKRISLALCYPIPVCNLLVLAAVQLLIHDFVENYPGNLSVLLISSRMEVREHYLRLQIRNEPLANALPLARIRAEGNPAPVSVSGQATSQRPRLYHLSSPRQLNTPWPRDIGAIIVDHTTTAFDELTTRIHELARCHGIPSVIHLCTDPFAPFLEELTLANVPVWFWDHYGLATDFGEQLSTGDDSIKHPFGVSARQFQNIACGIRHHTRVCRHSVLEDAARRLWDDLSTVQRTFSGRSGLGIRQAIRAAYDTYYTMLQMLVPLPVYEEEARNMWGIRPLSRRIADLEAFTPLLCDEAPELAEVYWPSLIIDLKEMRAALEASNPKYDTLIQMARDYLGQKKSLAIVCPNQAIRRMLQLCLRAREGISVNELSEQDDSESLRLVTYEGLGALTYSDALLFPGQFSYGRRRYILTAAAPEHYYLAYGDEADRIEQQIAVAHCTLSERIGSSRERTWVVLAPCSSDKRLPEPDSQLSAPLIEFTRSEGKRVSRRTVTVDRVSDLSLWTPFSSTEYDLNREDSFNSNCEEALRPSEFAPSTRQSVMVSALRIDLVDGFFYAEPDSRIEVFLPSTGKTDTRIADGLRPEDIVIFVNGDQRRRLYDAILERIGNHPAMVSTYILVRYWQQAVREGFFRSGMTYDEFLRKLRDRGSKMQTVAGIRCWVNGEVLGPGDEQDIRRVGKIFSDEALVQECMRIDRALRRIRGLHISLARKLNRIIVQVGLKSQQADAADERIDQELNLYLDDFRDSVTVHRVVTVSQETKQVPYIFTGRLLTKEGELK